MTTPVVDEAGQYVNLNASGLIKTGQGTLEKIICAASSSGTVTVYDNTAGSGTVILTSFPVTAGQVYLLDISFNTGCYITLGGTSTLTVTYGP